MGALRDAGSEEAKYYLEDVQRRSEAKRKAELEAERKSRFPYSRV